MKYRTAYPNELYHHGILGMKWGVRRYQNYDGTRIGTGGAPVIKPSSLKGGVKRVGTGEAQRSSIPKALKKSVAGGQGGKAEGNAKLAAEAPKVSDTLFGPNVKKGKDKEKSSHVKEALKDIGDAAEGAGKLADHAKKRDKNVKAANEKQLKTQQEKARKMSDKELRDSINRIKMEREYTSLTTKEVETGYDKFKDVMGEVKDVAMTAAAIAGLVLTLIKIRNSLKHSDELSLEQTEELNYYLDMIPYDDELISHTMGLDLDYVLNYFDLTDDFLEHHGIKGMKWGVRRFQNYDGTRIGTGSGVGGGGGSSKGEAKLAASIQDTKRSKNTQEAIDAYKKAQEISDKEVRPLQEKLWDSEYDFHHPNNQKTVQALQKAIEKRDSYVDIYVKKFKDIPYNEIDDEVLKLGQHFNTFKYTKEVDETYKGPVIESGGKRYKHESINPYVEVLGDAPGGEMALRRKPKVVDQKADEELKKKLADDLRKSQKQDSRDYYRIKTFGK